MAARLIFPDACADTQGMHDNVDRRLLAHWADSRERHAEEHRFTQVIQRERGLRPVPAGNTLFEDQLAALRGRIEEQRAALDERFHGDDLA